MSRLNDNLDEEVKIIHEFIRDKVDKAGAQGVVLGLSGGLDSATVLKLCIDSLGIDKVHCIINPESASPEEDMRDARWLTEKWDVKVDEVGIDSILEEFPVDPAKKLPYANLKARVRMCVWYYFANVEHNLVIGTSNKSEILLGYTTKYGDSAADFLPIGDMYKSDVRKLAEKIGVPDRFLNKVPRAGLWEGQTDESELGYSYEDIDKVLKGIEDLKSTEEIAEKDQLDENSVTEIENMVKKSAHKRKIPTIIKLRNRTVGLDWYEYTH